MKFLNLVTEFRVKVLELKILVSKSIFSWWHDWIIEKSLTALEINNKRKRSQTRVVEN